MSDIITEARCAIYTRKSTEEGLDMEFNSLDAQREAGEAYIASQRHRGWHCLPDHYDDGGFSGGNTNRPALARLKRDIAEGKVDVIVVYKIDRLSRSLMDFAALLTLFDKHSVAFVSVTQDINTSSSSGRMMLNILMTFAQYEREIIAERIRDKIAAAKKKGMHTGGIPPMGYRSNPATKKLEVVEEEAGLVRRIFAAYIRLGSARDVACELEEEGLRTRTLVSRRGRTHGGGPFTPAFIYAMLQNPLYIGLVRHHDKTWPGEQEGIIAKNTWDAAQHLLKEHLRFDGRRQKRLTALRGLVFCGCCGGLMKESFSKRLPGKRYRYFICGKDSKRIRSTCALKRVPAQELEALLLSEIGGMLAKPEVLAGILQAAKEISENGRYLKIAQVREACADLGKVWEVMFPVEQYQFIRAVIAKVTVFPDQVKIEYDTRGLEQIILETEEVVA
ncbi:MAG: recombinase family protein [Candidatus Methanomethylophilaceae archaeon]|nr:recombinase family protein [Candidatus Methanomethylophilaceae archaeon]